MRRTLPPTVALAVLVALPACRDAPTQPEAETATSAPEAPAVLRASAREIDDLRLNLSDAVRWILPALDASEESGLAAELEAVRGALHAGEPERLTAVLERTRGAFTPLHEAAGEESLAELAAIELMLDLAATVLPNPTDDPDATSTPFDTETDR